MSRFLSRICRATALATITLLLLSITMIPNAAARSAEVDKGNPSMNEGTPFEEPERTPPGEDGPGGGGGSPDDSIGDEPAPTPDSNEPNSEPEDTSHELPNPLGWLLDWLAKIRLFR